MSGRRRVEVDVARKGGAMEVRWTAAGRSGGITIDHVPGTRPEWLGCGDDLVAGLDRRSADSVIAELTAWAAQHSVEVGLWWQSGEVETLA